MLLKYTQSPLVGKGGKGKGKLIRTNGGHRLNSSLSSINTRIYRKHYYRLPGKRPNLGKLLPRISPPAPSDSSNDSGLGLDGINHYYSERNFHQQQQQQPLQHQQQFNGFGSISSAAIVAPTIVQPTTSNFLIFNQHKFENDSITLNERHHTFEQKDEQRRPKRARVASIALESEDACSNDTFMINVQRGGSDLNEQQQEVTPINYSSRSKQLSNQISSKYNSMSKRLQHGHAIASSSYSSGPNAPEGSVTRDGKVQLQIVSQPEQQHRARYQTEGSRGAIKDRKGSGFPLVKLLGYNKPAKLQIYIGTDVGRAAPHMFYQACKVSSKNSTPCTETKLDGTVVIEVDFNPETDMAVTCDCIGILKERNVDVELRFPDQQTPKSKKKSTRCRMVFKTEIINDDGETESLFICSQPIVCTQPPGVPEICRKSLSECPCIGGQELFIIGKNFSKDTRVIFKAVKKGTLNTIWEESIVPEQEFLQQTHLICAVPPYFDTDIVYPVNVHLFIVSNGKKSESHNFLYTPQSSPINNTLLSQLSLTAISGPKAIQQAHGKPSHRDGHVNELLNTLFLGQSRLGFIMSTFVLAHEQPQIILSRNVSHDVPIFVSNDEFSENIIGEREKLSGDTKINVMAPPAPPTVSLMSIDLQREPSDLQALALVKAELLEETSQSSLMGSTSGSDTITTSETMLQGAFGQTVAQHCAEREESEKMDVVQSSIIVTHQPSLSILSNEIIEMQIKQEIARRNSQEYSMLGVENSVAMDQTSNLSTETMFPQAVPSIQSEAQKSQMLMDQYQTSLVAATTAQLSLHNTQNVLITHDPTTIRSPENIMNTNMAPTIMVPTVHGGLETVNPILSTSVLAPVSNALLSVNVIPQTSQSPSTSQTSSSMSMNQDAPPIAIHERTSPVAVKAMILNAAAEILSSPEQPSAETRSTINALIALDTEQILNGQKLDTTTINSPTVAASIPDTSREFNSSSNLTGSHLMDKEIRVEMSLNSGTTAPPDTIMHVVSSSQQLPMHQQSSVVTLSPETQQTLQGNIQQNQQPPSSSSSQLQQSTTNNNVQTSIPQEIATMSDNDIISFFNPNAFDQV